MDTGHEQTESPSYARFCEVEAVAPVDLDDGGQLIAAIPSILRFAPARSLVLALLSPAADSAAGPRAIPVVVRVDLDAVTDPARSGEIAPLVEAISGREAATAAIAIVVDDRPRAAATAQRVVKLLQSSTVKLTHGWLVPTITVGASFRGLLDGDSGGTVHDPAASPLAFTQALHGIQIHNSRTELAALIAADPDSATALAPLIDPAVEHYRAELHTAIAADRGTAFQRGAVRAVFQQIATVGESGCTPQDLATVVAALRDVMVRDVMLGLAGTSWAPAARILWQSVARATTGRDRAEAAMLCGYDAYHRGDAVYAKICLEAALHADSEHSMAVVLNAALDNGERPAAIAKIAHAGRQIAAGLGVDLTGSI